jgi:hypothetical protein
VKDLLTKILISAFRLLAGCFFLGLAISLVRTEIRYGGQGEPATAQVLQKTKRYSGGRHGSGWHYKVEYRYQDAAGTTFEGRDVTSWSTWEKCEVGQDVLIVYLRDAPHESRLAIDPPVRHWFGKVLGIGYLGSIGLFCLLGIIRVWSKSESK